MSPDKIYPVFFAQTATEDLSEICEYLSAQAGDAAATEIIAKIQGHCRDLSMLPFRFPPVEGFHSHVRRALCSSWTIYYEVTEQINVLRILHHSRQVVPDMLNG